MTEIRRFVLDSIVDPDITRLGIIVNRLVDRDNGNATGRIWLLDDAGDQQAIIGSEGINAGDVLSAGNYPLWARSAAGNHARFQHSDETHNVLAVQDAGLTIQGTVTITGNTTITGTFGVTGNSTLTGTLTVSGATTLQSTLAVTGVTTLTGALIANGAVTLGDAAADAILVKGTATFEQLVTGQLGLTLSGGNLTFSGTGQRITGDFGGATVANRVMVQSSAANAATSWGILPNGSSNIAAVTIFNTSNLAATDFLNITTQAAEHRIQVGHIGGAYRPLTFYNNNVEQMRIAANGDITIAPAAGKIGFFATSPAAQPVAGSAAGGTLAQVTTLANDLRTGLIALGLFS